MKIIDARGLACPEPVLLTKGAVDAGEKKFVVLVNDEIPKENIKRFCAGYNCSLVETREAYGWRLTVSLQEGGAKAEAAAECQAAVTETKTTPAVEKASDGVVFLIAGDKIGFNEELGKLLLEACLNTLPEATNKPKIMIFMNEGVRMTAEGSPVLPSLSKLSALGVEIRSCGTCLDYYGLKDKLQVGIITNMYDTVEALTGGDKVIRI